jgi:hypothetical protein
MSPDDVFRCLYNEDAECLRIEILLNLLSNSKIKINIYNDEVTNSNSPV